MAQLFGPGADRRLRRILLALAALLAAALLGLFLYERSSTRWNVGNPEPQPIAFPHNIHSGKLQIACRYCHTGAETEPSAGMPSVQTCLTCHSQIWRGTPQLQPLHRAAAQGTPIQWRSVSRLPAHSRFHHGAHAAARVPCATCHGRIETMPETAKAETLSMGWCVTCHRSSADHGVPPKRRPGAPQSHRDGRDLTDCTVCHY